MIPQAFTTRDMSEAYRWLQTLPQSVREEMKSMEQVVAFYLKAKRLGGALPSSEELARTTPPSKSSQDFQKTLKNLQHELEQFDLVSSQENSQQAPASQNFQAPSQNNGSGQQSPLPHGPGQPSQNQGQVNQTHPPQSTHHYESQQQQTAQLHQQPLRVSETPPPNLLSAIKLDPKSRQILNEVRDGLNLSSDLEVIRMSLVIAHRQLTQLLK